MSYTKHNFQSGEKLYASQLNAMDDQIALNESRIDEIEENATVNYNNLTNKPSLNGVTLSGNMTSADLGIPSAEGIPDMVDDWLDENISNPDSPPLDRSLSSSSAAAPADLVGEELTSIKEDFTKLTKNRFDFIVFEDGAIDDTGHFIANTARVRSKTKITHDFSVVCPDGLIVFRAVFFNATTNAFVSYSTINNQKASITVASGNYALLVLRKPDNSAIQAYDIAPDGTLSTIISDIATNTNSINTINTKIETYKNCYVQYKSTSGTDTTGEIDIFIPNKNGYTKYQMLHNVYDVVNCDIWRIHQVLSVNNNFTSVKPFTTYGELEMAIMLQGRSDYIGGRTHGDELEDEIIFIVDGKLTDITAITSRTVFNCLRIVEESTLYDPADGTTVVGKHGKEYIFTKEGLTLCQTVKWSAAVTVTEAYLSMLIGPLNDTDHIFTNTSFTNDAISNDTSRTYYPKATQATVYGASSGISETLEVVKYPEGLTGGDQLEMRVTANSNNKLYAPVVMTSEGYTTTVNELWQSATKFMFEANYTS